MTKLAKPVCKGCGVQLRIKPYNKNKKTRCHDCRRKTSHKGRNGYLLKAWGAIQQHQRKVERARYEIVKAERPRFLKICNKIIGSSYALAIASARVDGYRVRLAKRDGVSMLLTQDFDINRLNVEVKDDNVVAVTLG